MTEKEITGRHVLIGTIAAFGVIIAVNVTMAVKAVGTFPGLEVKNSYVASQTFETRREAQEALGWQVEAGYADGALRIAILDADGRTADPSIIAASIGRSTVARDDRDLTLSPIAGEWVSRVDLEPGQWVLILNAESAAGEPFAKRISLRVR